MAKLLKWEEETGGNQSSNNQRVYLKIEPNIEYRVRPVEWPVKFERFYNRDVAGKFHSAIAGKPDECPIRNGYDLEPKARYAINVIDRADGKLKIMEFPYTVYEELRKWKEIARREPGGKDGIDFLIKKTGSGQKQTRWTCKCAQDVDANPWTPEDLAQISEEHGGHIHNLGEVYAATPIDKIEERLGLIVGSTVGTAKADSVVTVAADLDEGGVAPEFGDETGTDENVMGF